MRVLKAFISHRKAKASVSIDLFEVEQVVVALELFLILHKIHESIISQRQQHDCVKAFGIEGSGHTLDESGSTWIATSGWLE